MDFIFRKNSSKRNLPVKPHWRNCSSLILSLPCLEPYLLEKVWKKQDITQGLKQQTPIPPPSAIFTFLNSYRKESNGQAYIDWLVRKNIAP